MGKRVLEDRRRTTCAGCPCLTCAFEKPVYTHSMLNWICTCCSNTHKHTHPLLFPPPLFFFASLTRNYVRDKKNKLSSVQTPFLYIHTYTHCLSIAYKIGRTFFASLFSPVLTATADFKDTVVKASFLKLLGSSDVVIGCSSSGLSGCTSFVFNFSLLVLRFVRSDLC